jgi:hypothetical protein
MSMARLLLGLGVVAVLTIGCPAVEEPAPSITAQGFELAQPREALAGAFSNVRLRFEVPAGIENLVVRERSYEIDLGKSSEAGQFPLFGIGRRVWSKRDVTLDFSGYLNTKLQRAGVFVLTVEVTDRNSRKARADLQIVVSEPDVPEEEPEDDESAEPAANAETNTDADIVEPTDPRRDVRAEPLGLREERPFQLQRVGKGPVQGGERFGITWKTVDEITVVIRMATRDDQPGRLARVDPLVYGEISSRDDLARALDRLELADTLEISTANDAANGAVVAVVRQNEHYLLRTDHSTTSLSDLGTTVTLSGRYRD